MQKVIPAGDQNRHISQPTSETHSTTLLGDTWIAEILFDNLLHQGTGPTEADAVLNALDGIEKVLRGHTRDG